MPLGDGEWYDEEESDAPDFVNVGPIPGPPLSSTAPGDETEPHRVTAEAPPAEAASEAEPEAEPLPTFDPRVRRDFEGLLYLGALTKEFEWMGHRFVIKTLSVDEVLEVAVITQDWLGTMGEAKAYQAAMASACVVSVDGKKMPEPISANPGDSPVRNRFDVVRRWYPTTLDVVYEQYLLLERRVAEVMDAMGKVNGSSPMASTPG